MIGAFWAYDGWHVLAFCSGEIREPDKNLPAGWVTGTLVAITVFILMNLLYLRAMTPAGLGSAPAMGQTAATVLIGERGGRLITAAILLSILGTLAAVVLECARLYLPMAQDGVFFTALARIHPVYKTPGRCLVEVLPAALAGESERIFRFQREAELLASLTHSNIAIVHDFQNASGRQFLVMEFVDSTSVHGDLLARFRHVFPVCRCLRG
jgi:amino acid transporter